MTIDWLGWWFFLTFHDVPRRVAYPSSLLRSQLFWHIKCDIERPCKCDIFLDWPFISSHVGCTCWLLEKRKILQKKIQFPMFTIYWFVEFTMSKGNFIYMFGILHIVKKNIVLIPTSKQRVFVKVFFNGLSKNKKKNKQKNFIYRIMCFHCICYSESVNFC